jgi:hypothetical protein
MARNETTADFEVFELPMIRIVCSNTLSLHKTFKTSAKQFAAANKVEYVVAQNFLKFLVSAGVAKELEPLKIAGKKGKPTNIYEVPHNIALKVAA